MERGAKEESEKKISRKRGRGREEGMLLPRYPLPHPLVNFFFCLHLFALFPRFERLEQLAKPVSTYLFLKTLVVGLADIPLGRRVLSQLSWPGYKSFFFFFYLFHFRHGLLLFKTPFSFFHCCVRLWLKLFCGRILKNVCGRLFRFMRMNACYILRACYRQEVG